MSFSSLQKKALKKSDAFQIYNPLKNDVKLQSNVSLYDIIQN